MNTNKAKNTANQNPPLQPQRSNSHNTTITRPPRGFSREDSTVKPDGLSQRASHKLKLNASKLGEPTVPSEVVRERALDCCETCRNRWDEQGAWVPAPSSTNGKTRRCGDCLKICPDCKGTKVLPGRSNPAVNCTKCQATGKVTDFKKDCSEGCGNTRQVLIVAARAGTWCWRAGHRPRGGAESTQPR